MINAIALALAPVFFVLVAGYLAGRLKVVDNRNVAGLNAFVMQFALPAALFLATASATQQQLIEEAPLFAVLGGVMLGVHLAWFFAAKALWSTSAADASMQALTIAFPNLAGVALPIAAAVIGPSGTVPVAVALSAGSIIVSPLSLIIVEMSTAPDASRARRARIATAFRRALTKPVVVAPALGIAVSLSGLTVGPIVEACLALLGHAAAGVALFLTGLVLSAQPLKIDWRIVVATFVADIARPLLTAAVVLSLPLPAETVRIAILLAAMPSGFFGILFAVSYRLDSAAIGSMVTASTALSLLTLAIAIALLFPG